ncbi:MAG: hypothetical protein HY885_13415 [Deltaproteobacteria bacterium]|nr:hypothetical protein [Deltaproteobacteria bacterium]
MNAERHEKVKRGLDISPADHAAAARMTFRVGILGIDGSGKSTLVAGLEHRLAASLRVMSVGQRVTLHTREGERLDLLGPLPESAHPLRHLLRNLERHWVLQRLPALLARYRPDICLEDRDTVIDFCALVTAHLPALRHLTPGRRVRIFSTLTHRSPADMYLFLRLPAAVAAARLQGKRRQTRRLRALHETAPLLERVAAEYPRFLDYLAEINVPAVVLDARLPAATVLDAAVLAIRDFAP